jgi:hypothetical protein
LLRDPKCPRVAKMQMARRRRREASAIFLAHRKKLTGRTRRHKVSFLTMKNFDGLFPP